jgi:hypothetical protein
VPNLRTVVTELGTGLGLLGHPEIDQVLTSRPKAMRSLSPEDWDQLDSLRAGGAYDVEFHAAWENGRAFFLAGDGLRGRQPLVVEWKGSVRSAGDEVAPVDLRVDHVYLVSCKYLSNILFNVAPANVFDALLVGGQGRRGRGPVVDWYADVAPEPYQRLYELVRHHLENQGPAEPEPEGADHAPSLSTGGPPSLPGLELVAAGTRSTHAEVAPHPALNGRDLPARAVDLTTAQRVGLGKALHDGWPGEAKAAYRALSDEVARASARRWLAALSEGAGAREAMLWRLLRMGGAPYFVLGSSATQSLRLRIATPWDWRQQFSLARLEVFAQEGGQPRVGWRAEVKERASGHLIEVLGHVEVRWSHGRFGGLPEAKGYIDTPHHLIPGYFPLR